MKLSSLLHRRRTPSTPAPRPAYAKTLEIQPRPAIYTALPSKGYNIHDEQSPDWHRFTLDAQARGLDVHMEEWHRSHFGSFTNVYVRRRCDGLIIPADAAQIWAASVEIWDMFDAYFETLERARDRHFAQGKPFDIGNVPGRPDWPGMVFPPSWHAFRDIPTALNATG
jgi:hypothetical protein